MLGQGHGHGRAVSKRWGKRVISGCRIMLGIDWRLRGGSRRRWGQSCGDREEGIRQRDNKEVMFEILNSEEEHSRLPRGESCARQKE